MADFNINKGESKNLPTAIKEGSVYVTIDEGGLYVDIDNTERLKIADASRTAFLYPEDNEDVDLGDITTEMAGYATKEYVDNNFATTSYVDEAKYEKLDIDTTSYSDAYNCKSSDAWVPMFPTGQPDNTSTWPEWGELNFAYIQTSGCKDLYSLNMISSPGKNTAIAINAGMVPGNTYTISLYAKGTSDAGQCLSSYGNGDFVIIYGEDLTSDWKYYEVAFTATMSQFNLMARDWGNTELAIDNISIKDEAGTNILQEKGNFRQEKYITKTATTQLLSNIMSSGIAGQIKAQYVDSSSTATINRTEQYGLFFLIGENITVKYEALDSGSVTLNSNTHVLLKAKSNIELLYSLRVEKGTLNINSPKESLVDLQSDITISSQNGIWLFEIPLIPQ